MNVAFWNSQSCTFNESSIGEICVAKCEAKNGLLIVIGAIYISPNQNVNKILNSSMKIYSFIQQQGLLGLIGTYINYL